MTHQAPRHCPVCGDEMELTRLGCPSCGTELSGSFEACEYCSLPGDDRELLRVFLSSRGNMKELERHLGVSYPTARARFDALLGRLGMGPAPEEPVTPVGAPAGVRNGSQRPSPAHLAVLQRLARGEIDVQGAEEAIESRATGTSEEESL